MPDGIQVTASPRALKVLLGAMGSLTAALLAGQPIAAKWATSSALANEDAGFSAYQAEFLCDVTRENAGNPGWERWCQNFPGPPRPEPRPPYPDSSEYHLGGITP